MNDPMVLFYIWMTLLGIGFALVLIALRLGKDKHNNRGK